ncbi:hypothetical protein SLS62_000297 [Diatrype stigma]|uniref:AB hydrolase-1 domain-containing protein n=1 Tax=Diatrype stigma TaxID=117547 RepID=A0AAN9VB51_9PEZI
MATSTTTAAPATEHKLLIPDDPPRGGATTTTTTANEQRPLVIFFHGSGGESCSPSWDALATLLASPPHRLRVLLYDRGPGNPKPEEATADLRAYLERAGLWVGAGGRRGRPGPYILIAHSYGGAFAREFIRRCGASAVAGAVLVETGQEGGLDRRVEEEQRRRCVLGARPLSVVRGNSFLWKWRELEAAEAEAEAEAEAGSGNGDGATAVAELEQRLRLQREMLQMSDEEDERLKKGQLAMSKNARYVHVPDCGHHVIRDRPDIVAAEVFWVLENMEVGKQGQKGEGRLWVRTVGKLRSILGR